MSHRCPVNGCQEVFDDEMDLVIHYTGAHQDAPDEMGAVCPTCREFVAFEDVVTHSDTHIQNSEIPLAPAIYKVSCLLDHLNVGEQFRTAAHLLNCVQLLFEGCVFYRGSGQTVKLSQNAVGYVRNALVNRRPPKNMDILAYMQDAWEDPLVADNIDPLFRPTANELPLPRRTSRTTDNLLHICLYLLLTHVHKQHNRKRDLFKRPEDFPPLLSVRLREKLSCLSRYLEAAMQTLYPLPVPDLVVALDTCNVCSEENVECVSMCTSDPEHTSCKACIMRHSQSELENGEKTIFDVRCMFGNDHRTAAGIVRWAIGPFAYLERMQKSQETALAVVKLVRCPNTQCGFNFVREDMKQDLQCPECRVLICQHCNRLDHETYQTTVCLQTASSEYEGLLNAGMTLCPNPKCRIPVQRDDMEDPACIHMTCRCGHGYCWLCLEDWDLHRGSFYACTRFKSDDYHQLYDDSIRRYYPYNPLSTFSTLDMSAAPDLHSLTIDRFRRGRLPLPENLTTDGKTLCPRCFETATKSPVDVQGLHTTCPSCDYEYCWRCLRIPTDHPDWSPGNGFQSTCGLQGLPIYEALYNDYSRKVYPGLNNTRFDAVQTDIWPYLAFKLGYTPSAEEIRVMELVRAIT